MKTRIEIADLNELVKENTYPDNYGQAKDDIVERTYDAEQWLGSGHFQETFFNGMHIGYGEISLARNTSIKFLSDFETVEMHFSLLGHTLTKDSFSSQTYEFCGGQHNIVYASAFDGMSHWSNGGIKTFEVNLLPEFFISRLPEGHKLFKTSNRPLTKNVIPCWAPEITPLHPKCYWPFMKS